MRHYIKTIYQKLLLIKHRFPLMVEKDRGGGKSYYFLFKKPQESILI